jgi:hypothetical protein
MSDWNKVIQSDAFKALSRDRASPPADIEGLVEKVARAIAYEFDLDADVFIGMHGQHLWEKQWHSIARAALEAIDLPTLLADRERMREALEHAAHTFRCYADLHNRKGTDEGRAKAERNKQHAEIMDAALHPEGNG